VHPIASRFALDHASQKTDHLRLIIDHEQIPHVWAHPVQRRQKSLAQNGLDQIAGYTQFVARGLSPGKRATEQRYIG